MYVEVLPGANSKFARKQGAACHARAQWRKSVSPREQRERDKAQRVSRHKDIKNYRKNTKKTIGLKAIYNKNTQKENWKPWQEFYNRELKKQELSLIVSCLFCFDSESS